MNKTIQRMIIGNILFILDYMKNNKIILFMHCDDGIHRTGTVLYTLLRACRENKESTLDALKSIRKETFNKCGLLDLIMQKNFWFNLF